MAKPEGKAGTVTLARRVGRAIRIGRGVVLTVIEAKDGEALLQIEAPLDEAVTRDDYGVDVHLQFQLARELGRPITLEEALARARQAREVAPEVSP